ncbi:hypothetical protein ACFLZX_00925 [Nanoarchaeota archaeon]
MGVNLSETAGIEKKLENMGNTLSVNYVYRNLTLETYKQVYTSLKRAGLKYPNDDPETKKRREKAILYSLVEIEFQAACFVISQQLHPDEVTQPIEQIETMDEQERKSLFRQRLYENPDKIGFFSERERMLEFLASSEVRLLQYQDFGNPKKDLTSD